jgi:hypothetical protein
VYLPFKGNSNAARLLLQMDCSKFKAVGDSGVASAAWHSWGVLSRHNEDQLNWQNLRILYECSARLDDNVLKERESEFGTINVKNLCSFDGEDHWVSHKEIADVRNGVMEFKTSLNPFDGEGTIIIGLFGALITMFTAFALLTIIRLLQWVWGNKAT